MKIISAATVTLIFLIVLALTFGCEKEGLAGKAVKAAVSDSEGNASSASSGSGTSEESQEGCAIDSGLLDRIFSRHGSL